MSDRLADIIAAKFRNEVGPKLAEAFHADQYWIYGFHSVSDGYAGITESRYLVESGTCLLEPTGSSSGGESLIERIGLTESDYTVEISSPTSRLTTNHEIEINGRTFDVVDVKRGGEAEMFTYASLKEAGPRS